MKHSKISLFNDPETIYVGYEDYFKEEFVKPFGESEDLKKFPSLLFNTNLKLEKVTLYQDPSGESGFHKFSFSIPIKDNPDLDLVIAYDLKKFFKLNSESTLENPIALLPRYTINGVAHINILYGWSA